MALPDPAHAARGDLDVAQRQFLRHPQRSVAGVGHGMLENGLLDRLGDTVGVRIAWPGQTIEQAVCPIGLEVAADLVELLTRIAHHLAGFRDVAEIGGEIKQAELAPCYLLVRGHVVLRRGLMLLATPS